MSTSGIERPVAPNPYDYLPETASFSVTKDWDLSWNAALETGGVLVSEKIKLELDVSAIKSA